MQYLIGSKEEFMEFVDSITPKDRISILSHNDLDGIASAIFLEEILKANGLERNLRPRRFLDYSKSIFSVMYPELKKEKISRLFISDLSPENVDLGGFEKLRTEFDVFSIDHHPIGKIDDKSGIIKTETGYCTAFVCYDLGDRILDRKKWKWLVDAACISDMSYKNPEVMKFIQETNPEVTMENIHDSEIGMVSSAISSSLIYFDNHPEKIYELVREKKIQQLKKYDIIVRKEVGKWMKKYDEEAEFHPDRNMYFYYYNPKFNITSTVSTILSQRKPDSTFIAVSDSKTDKGFVKISARNQNSREDMNQLMKKGIEGLENATGGGHIPAAGGKLMKKDLEKFKNKILNL